MRLMYLVPAMMLFTAEAAAVDGTAVGEALGRCDGAASAILLLLDHYDWPDVTSADERAAVEGPMQQVSRNSRYIAEGIAESLTKGPDIGFASAGADAAFLTAVFAGAEAGRDRIASAAATGSLSVHDVLGLVRGCGASMKEANALLSEIGAHLDMALRRRGMTE